MQRLIVMCFLLCTTLPSYCQNITHKLIGTAGSTFGAGGFQLSYSIGEPVVLPSPSPTINLTTYPVMVTIGFQQPHVAQTGALLSTNNWISAYPNPTTGHVRLDIHGDNFQSNFVKVYNGLKQIVAVIPFKMINGSIDLNLQNLAAGAYYISVTDEKVGNTITTTIIKMN